MPTSADDKLKHLGNIELFRHCSRKDLEAIAAITEERNRMAQEFHDSLAQGLTGIVIQLNAAQALLTRPLAIAMATMSAPFH